ncbi:MAG: DNA polymerase III subunit gamma/tau [Nitrospiraceae bacterium]|nr:DNA polymerase III subunit gamma/tau [Nitrospiraceae bacterium]
MSYLVLARKWRPQIFEDVIGQGHVTRTLQNALKSDRIAHALLFSGPRGVGKTSVARILAKAMNCESGPSPDPCTKCLACREITAGSAVDVQEIDGASNRGIDEIRQLREGMLFQPTRCRYKIYIIDEVHMLTKEAFNALLKTLEEPPPHVYFILATTEPQKIPATIHSRCQHYEFRRLGTLELADYLDKIVQAEGMGLQRDVTLLLAREASGSVRDALSLLDQVTAYGATSLKEVCEALGVVETKVLKGLAIAILEGDMAKALGFIDEVYNFGKDIQKFTLDLVLLFRHLMVLKSLGPEKAAALVDLSREDIDELSSTMSGYTAYGLFQIIDALIKGQEAIYRSSTPKLSLEILVTRLCTMREVVGIDEVLGQVNRLLSSGRDKKEFSPEPSPKKIDTVPVQSPVPISQTPRRLCPEMWTEFVGFVKKQRPSLGSLLVCCGTAEIGPGEEQVRLVCQSSMQQELLSDQDNRQRLKKLTQEFFGHVINVRLKERPDVDKQDAEETARDLRDKLIQSQLVQKAVELFQARIYDVKLFRKKNRQGVI